MKPQIMRWILRSLFWSFLCSGISFIVLWWIVPYFTLIPKNLIDKPDRSPIFLSSDGVILQKLLSASDTRHEGILQFDEISPLIIQATLAAEDKRFFEHHGIDFYALLRAVRDNMLHRRTISGASTITQQLIKISSGLRQPRELTTKIRECLLARSLEMRWSKKQILAEYLNRLNYGHELIGIEAASLGYFDKHSQELSPAEAALLAGLPQSPTRLNPFKNFDLALNRQKRILALMHEQSRITSEQYELAQTETLTFRRHQSGFTAPHLVDMLRSKSGMDADYPIHTTIDSSLQDKAIRIIQGHLEKIKSQNVNQGACVVIENQTGKVRALVGSRDFWHSKDGQINGAWAAKSPGSAIKPFTYVLALENGLTPASLLADIPVSFNTPTGSYSPENYDLRYYGPIPLRQALGNSLNIPSVRLLHEIGGAKKLYQKLKQLGLTTLNEPAQHYGLGLTLGNAPVRLLELTNAYACLARKGKFYPWSLLENDSKSSHELQVFSEAGSYLIADILCDHTARTQTFGARSVLNFDFPCAVKTGTSTDYRDNWAIGYTPEYTVGVWVGNFDNSTMRRVSGVSGAGPILRDIFYYLKENHELTWYEKPTTIETVPIDWRIGKVWSDELMVSSSFKRMEHFIKGTVPPQASASDYTEDRTRSYVDPIFKSWLNHSKYWLTHHLSLREDRRHADQAPIIEFPLRHSVYFLDPDLPDNGSKMRLKTRHALPVNWHSDTLQFINEKGYTYAILKVGTHSITASNAFGKHTVEFQVKDLGRKTSAN